VELDVRARRPYRPGRRGRPSCGDDQNWLADVLFLAFRGYYISSIEDPEHWSPDRAASALEWLLDLVESSTPGAKV
jgi:hypothetical protein